MAEHDEEVGVDQEVATDIEAMTTALTGDEEGVVEEAEEEQGQEGEKEQEGEPEGEPAADPNAALLAKLEAMEAKLAQLTAAAAAGGEQASTTPPAAPEEIDFLEGKSIDDVAGDEKAFNALLNKIYQRARTDAQEATLRSIPEVVKSSVVQQSTMQEKVTKFYKDNPDLTEWKGAVATVAQEIAGQHPEWTTDQVFLETEKETRRRLNLKKKAVAATTGTKPRGFAKGSGAQRGDTAQQLSDLEKEIAEMNKTLRSDGW